MWGSEIESAKGATEGDTSAMPVYSIGITPLLKKVTNDKSIKHVAYADDLGRVGKLAKIRDWWDNLCLYGPLFGYF